LRLKIADAVWQCSTELTFWTRSARTGSTIPSSAELDCSRHSFQRNDWQMLSAAVKGDFERQLRAGTAAHECPGLGTRRAARPTRSRFVARFAMGGKPAEIDFIRRPAAEPLVWPTGKNRGKNRGQALNIHFRYDADGNVLEVRSPQYFDKNDTAGSQKGKETFEPSCQLAARG
jgi:hypothetical protein